MSTLAEQEREREREKTTIIKSEFKEEGAEIMWVVIFGRLHIYFILAPANTKDFRADLQNLEV